MDEEQVRQQIKGISRKIAENEKLLNPITASPGETQEGQAPWLEDEVGASKEGEEAYGWYVYGIIGGDGSQPVAGLPAEGIDPAHSAYALPCQGIQAIVSKVPLGEFGQEQLRTNLNDLKWLDGKVHAHQRVLETVLASSTIVPMKFCTVYRSESRAQKALARYYDDFVDALARLDGKGEWGVTVYCDRGALAQRVGEVGDKVKQLRTEMAEKSSGAAYFVKKRLEKTIDEETERVCDECTQCSHDRLSGHVEGAVINPLRSKEITGRREQMLLNAAYLVAEEQLTAFRAELESLEEEYGQSGFSYEMTGRWPPYNFVTIVVEEGAADESVSG